MKMEYNFDKLEKLFFSPIFLLFQNVVFLTILDRFSSTSIEEITLGTYLNLTHKRNRFERKVALCIQGQNFRGISSVTQHLSSVTFINASLDCPSLLRSCHATLGGRGVA